MRKRSPRRAVPVDDTDELYGLETELLTTHGHDAPGPDQGRFPVPDAGDERDGRGKRARRRDASAPDEPA